ncbi:MAG TPA: DinB family protein [Phycisphaerae bacterium]|nr:DinB family protein [Phycisphaerae bacterium]
MSSANPEDSFSLARSIEILRNTPRVLRALLDGLSDNWVTSNYGEKTFSPFDVVGHLIHGEKTDWMQRMRLILEYGESRPFEPFDRYAMYESSRGKQIGELLSEFESLRSANLMTLNDLNLTPTQMNLSGLHPALGRVTLGQLIATWVVHDLNHIHQIAKCMAYRYRDFVGPWKAYLSILPQDE